MAYEDKPEKDFREEDLKQRFDFIQKVADLSPNILFVIDLNKEQIIFISKKVKELMGYDAEYILNQSSDIFQLITHPNDLKNRRESMERCKSLSGEEECEVEVRFRAAGNQWEWYRIREKIFQVDEKGKVSHILGIAQNIHEQKLAEEKLREEHRRLEHAQQIGHIGSFERKLPGDIMECSDEFFNILGILPRPEGFTIEEFYSQVHPEDRIPLENAVEKTHATGKPYDTITRIIRPDNTIRHIHRRAALIKDDQGVPVKVYGTMQDITERVKSENKRKRAEKLMRSTETLAGMGSYEINLEDDAVYFSEGLYRIFGEEPESFTPSLAWIDQHSHPDDVPVVQKIIDRAILEKTAYTYTRRITRKDGSLRIVEAHGKYIANPLGSRDKLIGIVQDVTERKKAEEELLRSEKRSRNLLEVLQNAPDAYLVVTPDFHIEMASDAYLVATETSREEIIGKYIFDVFPDNPAVPDIMGVENLRASFNTVLSTKKTHRMPILHYDVRDRSGNFVERHWSPTNSPVINSVGEVDYIIHRALDITEVMKEQVAVKGLVSETEMLKTSLEEIKLQAEQLKENRALLQSVFDASPNSIILYKTLYDNNSQPEDFEFFMVNEYNYLSLELPRNIKGKRFSQVFPNVHPTGVLDEFKKTAETGIPADFEVWYEGEGFRNWFHFRAAKLNGLLLATAEDITERKKTEETVQQMLNGSIAAITILQSVRNDEGKIIDFTFKGGNKAAENINQVPIYKLIGNKLLELFPGVKGAFFDSYVKVVETGEPLRIQRSYTKENFNHWFDVSAVKNGDGFIMTFQDITDQKKAENELIELKEELTQKATDKYQKIINSMDEGFSLIEIIRDASGSCVDYKFLETNPVFESQTGLNNVIGKTVNDLVPNLESYWKEIYGNVAKTGKSIRFEDFSEPMGRWFDVNAFRINAPDEQHVAIIFKDITERKEAEERKSFLLELNDAIRPLEDAPKIQETAMKILGTHLEVNRAHYSELLEDEDTLAGRKGFFKDIDPIKTDIKISEFSEDLQKHFKEGKSLIMENFLKAYESNEEATDIISESQVRAIIAVPLVKNEKLVAVVSVQQKNPRHWTAQEIALVEEVSEQTWAAMERAESEKAMRESEQRFRNLVEASALAVWETEPDGNILNESISWRNFTGQTYEEGLGEGWLNAVHIEDRERVKNLWKQAISNLSNFDAEFRLISASGDSRWTNVKAIPIYNTEGKVYKWSGMNLDIHDRKQAQEALLQAIEEAEAASMAKEDFLSTMSHEIRTPLNAVIGLTNLLLERNPRNDQKENLNSLSFSAKNLLALINNILDFSKLEAGKADLNITDFDLPLLLINLKQAHHPLAEDKQTLLELNIDKNIPDRIATDQLKLSQILHNLVSNAVKFTTRGKVSISVNLEKLEQDTLWLNFEIRDTGIGISEDKKEHIFEKFTQAESSTVRQYGGTGLGLSITRLLLELLNSEIKLESTPGEGSRFYFNLPVKKAKKEVPPLDLSEKSENIEDLQNLKILLVEDVEINRRIIIQFLQNWWQIMPDEAKNGKEAVELARIKQYDLILMDIRMPVMDGYEATRQIRKLSGYHDIPILALTADKNQEVQQAEHVTRFSGLLTKPFEPLDLKKKILLHLPVSYYKFREDDFQEKPVSSNTTLKQDSETREELLPLVLSQLKEYKTTFIKGIQEEDLEQLISLQHKSIVLLKIFPFRGLTEKLNATVTEFKKGANRSTVALIEGGKAVFDTAIERIEKEMEEPSYQISRYTAIAGKNKEILQKLIGNSVRTLELYQEEFTAAANDRDREGMSNLVHKNTTSIYYLQANHLKRSIEEFREMLEQPEVPEANLQEKQKEVLVEFDFIIAGLKSIEDGSI